ncbi:MAG: GIY-YIG nuclease family protein [Patescibacteria group bacterium]
MEYLTYVLLSLKNGDLYIGSTENINNRVELHNKGRVKSTKAYRPWKLMESHRFDSRSEAVKFERFLKSHQQREEIKRKYGQIAKR